MRRASVHLCRLSVALLMLALTMGLIGGDDPLILLIALTATKLGLGAGVLSLWLSRDTVTFF